MKKVSFSSRRPSEEANVAAKIDHWVNNRNSPMPEPKSQEPMKRLTIDVSVNLHRRIKSQCALKNLRMADEIRDLLERHFGEREVGVGAPS